MSPYFRVLRICLVGLAILGVISGATSGGAQSVTAEETVRPVRRISSVFRTTACSITSSSESIAALCTLPATASKGG
jgi:hypothetical protein